MLVYFSLAFPKARQRRNFLAKKRSHEADSRVQRTGTSSRSYTQPPKRDPEPVNEVTPMAVIIYQTPDLADIFI